MKFPEANKWEVMQGSKVNVFLKLLLNTLVHIFMIHQTFYLHLKCPCQTSNISVCVCVFFLSLVTPFTQAEFPPRKMSGRNSHVVAIQVELGSLEAISHGTSELIPQHFQPCSASFSHFQPFPATSSHSYHFQPVLYISNH